MITHTLLPQTLQTIQDYLHFPIGNTHISIPYFNNRRTQMRAGLRVTVGKGSLQDIAEEVEVICLKNNIDKTILTPQSAKKMLVDAGIGIDCSGFVYYILNAESVARGNGEIKKKLHFPKTTNFIRSIIRRWRMIENVNVELLAADINSDLITLSNVEPADIIVIIDAGYAGTVDHVLLVESVEKVGDLIQTINLIHAFAWSSDGLLEHGVRRAQINVLDITKSLLEQEWVEQGKSDKQNETLKRAREAKKVEIRRLKMQ